MNNRVVLYSIITAIAVAAGIGIAVSVFDFGDFIERNPPFNSVISAHGNTDWHIDTAEAFLTGKDMNGNQVANNHAPDSWTKTHILIGLTNTNHFYFDSDLATPGDDTDATSGIDRSMLFFHAGHGFPTYWDTLGNRAVQPKVNIGDGPSGLLRYYWQCSCQVFAHGPKHCPSTVEEYACPEYFDGSSDSDSMRNVYERWGPALGKDLRMACGVSTRAWCHAENVDRIWAYYNSGGLDVADSFIQGLHDATIAVPLCITSGPLTPRDTPLYDQWFTNQPHKAGYFLHIQYLSGFASNAPDLSVKDPPERIPVIETVPIPLPDPWQKFEFSKQEGMLVSKETVADRGPRMRIYPVSGAMYVRGQRKLEIKAQGRKEQEYIDLAMRHIREQGWSEELASPVKGMRFMIDSRPREGKSTEVVHTQKNVTVKLRRVLDIDGRKIPVYGVGGEISVQMNNDGSLLNAHKVWRKIVKTKKQARVKPYKTAEAEAMKELGEDAVAYTLADWSWGFKEEAGNVEQKELRMIYRFDYRPTRMEETPKYPPRIIEIDGTLDQ